jgi:hypothetical protein
MDETQLIVSMLSGGVAGGCISVASNRMFHWRASRTQFHPKLNNIFGHYAIRLEKPEGRYRTGVSAIVRCRKMNHLSIIGRTSS